MAANQTDRMLAKTIDTSKAALLVIRSHGADPAALQTLADRLLANGYQGLIVHLRPGETIEAMSEDDARALHEQLHRAIREKGGHVPDGEA